MRSVLGGPTWIWLVLCRVKAIHIHITKWALKVFLVGWYVFYSDPQNRAQNEDSDFQIPDNFTKKSTFSHHHKNHLNGIDGQINDINRYNNMF